MNSVSVTSNGNTVSGNTVKLKVLTVSAGAVTSVEVSDAGVGFQQLSSPVAGNVALVHPGTLGQLTVSPTGGSGATFTLKIKRGYVEQIDPRTEKMEITYDTLTAIAASTDNSLYFKVGDVIGTGAREIGEERKTNFKVASVYNKIFNTFRTNTTIKDFPRAKLTYQAAVTNSSGAAARGSTFVAIQPVARTFTTEEAALSSASDEFACTDSGGMAEHSYLQCISLNPAV